MKDPLEIAEVVLAYWDEEYGSKPPSSQAQEYTLAAEVVRLSERLSIATSLIHEMYVHISGPSSERCVTCDEEATEFLNSPIEV